MCHVQYIEEPLQPQLLQQLPDFIGSTGMHVALDETLDDSLHALITSPVGTLSATTSSSDDIKHEHPASLLGKAGNTATSAKSGAEARLDVLYERISAAAWKGVKALVVKPSIVGGIEATACVARWAQSHETQACRPFLMTLPGTAVCMS